MKKHRIIFRADGGTSIGMGHVVRSLALADMLKNDFSIAFAIQHTDESVIKTIQNITQEIIFLPRSNNFSEDASAFSQYIQANDIAVLDGYNFKTDYQKIIKAKNCKLVCIDDLHAWHFVADAIINHADDIDQSAYSVESYTKFYLGLNYILLRKEFLNASAKQKKVSTIKKIFISMGAADVINLSQNFTEALIQVNNIEEIHLMLGSINPHLQSIEELILKNKQIKIVTHFNISAGELHQLLNNCDIAICPASSISLECCATGIGLISGYTADNQLGILRSLIKHEAAVDFGNLNKLSVAEIKKNFEKLIQKPELFDDLIENQKKMIDGKSPERLLNVFKELIKEKLHFRFANEKDVDLYFKWTNDPLVRTNSFNQNPVAYQDHVKWFQSKLTSADCSFYLFLNEEDQPVGQVRIDKSGNEIVIGISIDEAFRGKSLGVDMLKAATADYLQRNPDSTIIAYIKTENKTSYNIFLIAGFLDEEIVTEQTHKSYKLYKALR